MQALVVGAGPGGLAVSRELKARGVEHVVLERGEGPGQSWAGVYDSLLLHTGKHLSALPGRRLPRSASLFVPATDYLAYLLDYNSAFDLPLRTRCAVTAARRVNGGWCVDTPDGSFEARSLVIATGIMSNPHTPEIAGRAGFAGTLRHSIEYLRPAPFVGRRVLVVGAGNSSGEIAPELAHAGADVTVAIRSGANVVPRSVAGVPI